MWKQLQEWDRDLFIYLNNLGVDEYDTFWIFVTKIEHWTPLYLLFFMLFFFAYKKKQAITGIILTIIVFVFTLGLTGVVKNLVGRLRPNNVIEFKTLIRVLQNPNSFSFFSGHAAVSFSITTFIVLALRHKFTWVYLFYIWPLVFVTSRILVGVHYPGDILVGALVGTSISVLSWRLVKSKFFLKIV